MQQLLTPKDTAKLLGVQVETLSVWRCTKRYPLRYVKIGTRVRYRAEDVQRFIERSSCAGTKENRS